MEIKVSVILPIYNVASYLDACLSSCINQTFQMFSMGNTKRFVFDNRCFFRFPLMGNVMAKIYLQLLSEKEVFKIKCKQ